MAWKKEECKKGKVAVKCNPKLKLTVSKSKPSSSCDLPKNWGLSFSVSVPDGPPHPPLPPVPGTSHILAFSLKCASPVSSLHSLCPPAAGLYYLLPEIVQ